MIRTLHSFVPSEQRHPVQVVRTEGQRLLYDTMIAPDDGHGQMQPA